MSEPHRQPASSYRSALGIILPLSVAWAVLAAAWNFYGVHLVSNGGRPLGPTASTVFGFVLLAIAAGFLFAASRWPLAYLALAVVGLLAGGSAVVNAFTADPSLWPSEFWRLSGAALNLVAVIVAPLAAYVYLRWKRGQA